MDQTGYEQLKTNIQLWGQSLGFQQIGITDTDLRPHGQYLENWLEKNFHGDMFYMEKHGAKRSRPELLIEATCRIISVRMNYLPKGIDPQMVLASDQTAYVARYSLGRDYHKVIRKRLVKLWDKIQDYLIAHDLPTYAGRVFTDSAPVLEKAIAEKAGLGWIGKNTLVLNKDAGSWFFLGEIFTNLPLPPDPAYPENHCGSCTACIDICPTRAIIAPYQLDARKCISYLTIEHRGVIPEPLRSLMGNRIFGCDDCQLVCPWNKFAKFTNEADFSPRHKLDTSTLLSLFAWSENEFLKNTEGSAIRRTGYDGWLRNIAIALGNSNHELRVIAALKQKMAVASDMLNEHINWAISRQQQKDPSS